MSVIVADPTFTQSPLRRLVTRALLKTETSALLFLLVLVIVFSVTANNFLTLGNIGNILEQIAIVGIVALGLNQIILAEEIDISVGSSLALTAAAAATVATSLGTNLLVTLLIAVVVATVIASISGVLVVVTRIPSIIVTLGMLYVLRGITNMVMPVGIPVIPAEVRVLGTGNILGVGTSVIVFLFCFTIALVIERHTRWGRDVPAVGGNAVAARIVGLPVNRIVFLTFVFGGVCVGIGSMVYIGQLGAVQPSAALGFELQVIAAVVVGGTAITGGRGSVLSVLIGSLVIATIRNGANLLGLTERWQSLFIGAVILIAIATDYARQRLVERLVN